MGDIILDGILEQILSELKEIRKLLSENNSSYDVSYKGQLNQSRSLLPSQYGQ